MYQTPTLPMLRSACWFSGTAALLIYISFNFLVKPMTVLPVCILKDSPR
jgi:hypothetical protein